MSYSNVEFVDVLFRMKQSHIDVKNNYIQGEFLI